MTEFINVTSVIVGSSWDSKMQHDNSSAKMKLQYGDGLEKRRHGRIFHLTGFFYFVIMTKKEAKLKISAEKMIELLRMLKNISK